MFHEERTVEIGDADAKRRLVESRDENPAAIGAEADKARGAASRRRTELTFVDQPEFGQRAEPVGHHRAAQLAVTLDFLARGRLL